MTVHITMIDKFYSLEQIFKNFKIKEDVKNWLNNYFEQITNKPCYEYIDNYRFAVDGNEKSIRDYDNRVATGCCGFYDSEVICPLDGIKYYFGFNYGH